MASTVTVTRPDKCTITVTHKIYFANPDNMPGNEPWFAAQAIKEQIKEKWEKPDFKFKCCKVKFKFEYPDKPGPDTDTKNLRTDAKAFKDKPENKDRDYGRSYQGGLGPEQSTGEWFLDKNIVSGHYHCDEASHEVGHELGAKDKYIEEWQRDGTKKTLPDPVAGYPKDGIMFDHNGTVQQQDIDEIIKAIGATCPDSCC